MSSKFDNWPVLTINYIKTKTRLWKSACYNKCITLIISALMWENKHLRLLLHVTRILMNYESRAGGHKVWALLFFIVILKLYVLNLKAILCTFHTPKYLFAEMLLAPRVYLGDHLQNTFRWTFPIVYGNFPKSPLLYAQL